MKKFFVVLFFASMSASTFAQVALGVASKEIIGNNPSVYATISSEYMCTFGIGYGFGASPFGAVLSTGNTDVAYKSNLLSMFVEINLEEYLGINQPTFGIGIDTNFGKLNSEVTENSVTTSTTAMSVFEFGINTKSGYHWYFSKVDLSVTAGVGLNLFYYYDIGDIETSGTYFEYFPIKNNLFMIAPYIPVAVKVSMGRFRYGVQANIGLHLWNTAKIDGSTIKSNKTVSESKGALSTVTLNVSVAYLF